MSKMWTYTTRKQTKFPRGPTGSQTSPIGRKTADMATLVDGA